MMDIFHSLWQVFMTLLPLFGGFKKSLKEKLSWWTAKGGPGGPFDYLLQDLGSFAAAKLLTWGELPSKTTKQGQKVINANSVKYAKTWVKAGKMRSDDPTHLSQSKRQRISNEKGEETADEEFKYMDNSPLFWNMVKYRQIDT